MDIYVENLVPDDISDTYIERGYYTEKGNWCIAFSTNAVLMNQTNPQSVYAKVTYQMFWAPLKSWHFQPTWPGFPTSDPASASAKQ